MALLVAIALALFVLPAGWDVAAVVGGAAIEVGEVAFWWRWSHRRRSAVGAEALVGTIGEMASPDWVRVNGELWRVHGDVAAGIRVRVRAVDGLTLDVEPVQPETGVPSA